MLQNSCYNFVALIFKIGFLLFFFLELDCFTNNLKTMYYSIRKMLRHMRIKIAKHSRMTTIHEISFLEKFTEAHGNT